MSSRMDKYKNTRETEEYIPTRSDKNKELYKQIYNAYDEFENLVVPSNAREINPSELKNIKDKKNTLILLIRIIELLEKKNWRNIKSRKMKYMI